MYSDLIRLGKSYFRLNHRWFTYFLLLEGVFLLSSCLIIHRFTPEGFANLERLDYLILCFLASFTLQMIIALHFALAFNSKSPEAWLFRSPTHRATKNLLPFLIIWINGAVIGVTLWPVWRLLFEWTALPAAAVALFFIPCIGFQIAQLIRNSILSVTSGILAALFPLCLLAAGVFWYYLGQDHHHFQKFDEIQTHGFFLGLSVLFVLIVDSNRRAFLKLTSMVGILLIFLSSFWVYQLRQIQMTPYHQRVEALHSRMLAQRPACGYFKQEAKEILNSSIHKPKEIPQLKDRAQTLQAFEALKAYPIVSNSQHEIITLWQELPQQNSPRTSFPLLLEVQSCEIVTLFDLVRPLITAARQEPELNPQERQMISEEIRKVVSNNLSIYSSYIDTRIMIDLIRRMVDYQLLTGISAKKLSDLTAQMDAHKEDLKNLGKSFIRVHALTNLRTRSLAESFYFLEFKPMSELASQLDELLEHSKIAPN